MAIKVPANMQDGWILPTILGHWFADDRHIGIDPKLEGTFHDVDRRLIHFGGRAGPSCEVSSVLHEMAHFVEATPERCVRRNWGIRMGTPFLSGLGVEWVSSTTKATEREVRVWAWQSVLEAELGIGQGIDDLVRSSMFMIDAYRVAGRTDKERIETVGGMVREAAMGKTVAAFDRIWHERVADLGRLLDREAEWLGRIEVLWEGQPLGERRLMWDDGTLDEEDWATYVAVRHHRDSRGDLYEVHAVINGEMVGEGYDVFVDEARAVRYAASMFGGERFRIREVEGTAAAPTA